jgi:hypothetical protein
MELKGFTNSNEAKMSSALLNLRRKLKMDHVVFWATVDSIQPGCTNLPDLTPANGFDLMVKLANKLYKN